MSSQNRKQALIADDNVDFAELIQDMFSAYVENSDDFEFTTVPSGEAACRKLNDKRYDFVILDVNLPGISGYEVVKSVLTHDSPNRRTPVLMISGDMDASPSNLKELAKFDNLYFIEKHAEMERIIRKIALFLGPGTLKFQGS